MSTDTPSTGQILWHDLTIPDASRVRDFYSAVVGWAASDVAGVCHTRGSNAKIPPQWLMYVAVADVETSAKKCVDLGGKLLDGPRKLGTQMFCIIQDPAGAVCALIAQ